MKKLYIIFIFAIFISIYTRGFGSFNPAIQRKVVIGAFTYEGEGSYAYLGKTIQKLVTSTALKIPFLILTEDERRILEEIVRSRSEDKTIPSKEVTIGYRLEPIIEEGEPRADEFPIFIHGRYRVLQAAKGKFRDKEASDKVSEKKSSGETIQVTIDVQNFLTKTKAPEYTFEAELNEFLNTPDTYLIPFIKQLVRYTIFTVSIKVTPQDATILIDRKPAGVGAVDQMLLTPGYHLIEAKLGGYSDYSDTIYVFEDGFVKEITLKEIAVKPALVVESSVPEVSIYIDGSFKGFTPLELYPGRANQTITLIKDGYRNRSMPLSIYGKETGEIKITMVEPGEYIGTRDEAELHRKRSRILYRSGLGMMGLAIFSGTQTTLNRQRADLYRGINEERYNDALKKTTFYSALTASTLIIGGGVFTLSFVELLKYFNFYSTRKGIKTGNNSGNR